MEAGIKYKIHNKNIRKYYKNEDTDNMYNI